MANSVPYRIWHFLRPWRSDAIVELTWTLSFIKSCSESQLRLPMRRPQVIGTTLFEAKSLLPLYDIAVSFIGAVVIYLFLTDEAFFSYKP